ncbi:MAG: hypothetical protein FJ294_09525 [Planctomycetes bacterium]|nr:hypothetical protein [Planctomycetota bacterium]
MSLPYALLAVALAATMLGWSYRNYKTCGYFGVSSMRALSDMQGEVQSGMLDPRVLESRGFYPDHVRIKDASSGIWSSWLIQDTLYERTIAQGLPEREQASTVEREFAEMVAAPNAPLPPPARLVKLIRTMWWNFQLAPSADFVQSLPLEDLSGIDTPANIDAARVLREAMLRDACLSVVARDAEPGPFGMAVLRPRQWYGHSSSPLLLLALAAACWMLVRGRPELAMPFFFVLANFALLSYLRQREFRYMGVMDMFLILQIVIALGHVATASGKQARPTLR